MRLEEGNIGLMCIFFHLNNFPISYPFDVLPRIWLKSVQMKLFSANLFFQFFFKKINFLVLIINKGGQSVINIYNENGMTFVGDNNQFTIYG